MNIREFISPIIPPINSDRIIVTLYRISVRRFEFGIVRKDRSVVAPILLESSNEYAYALAYSR